MFRNCQAVMFWTYVLHIFWILNIPHKVFSELQKVLCMKSFVLCWSLCQEPCKQLEDSLLVTRRINNEAKNWWFGCSQVSYIGIDFCASWASSNFCKSSESLSQKCTYTKTITSLAITVNLIKMLLSYHNVISVCAKHLADLLNSLS